MLDETELTTYVALLTGTAAPFRAGGVSQFSWTNPSIDSDASGVIGFRQIQLKYFPFRLMGV
jgi:hypothetical protein